MDLNAIATALATRYTSANLTAPSGEPAITASTSEPPDGIPNTPYVIVAASVEQEASFTGGAGSRMGVVPFSVDFFLETASDLARQMVRLQKWAGPLLDAPLAAIHLGIPSVVATTWTESLQISRLIYGGQEWAGVHLVVNVTVTEPISPVA